MFLIGPSGAGKSTVATLLAARLRLPVLDSDRLVERTLGMPSARAFAELGEPAFRAAERDALRETLTGPAAVIAVGAGALADPAFATALRNAGPVVLIDAAPEVIAARLGGAADRPLLAGAADLLGALRLQRTARDPGFRATAHHAVDGALGPPDAVAAAIAALLAPGRDATPG